MQNFKTRSTLKKSVQARYVRHIPEYELCESEKESGKQLTVIWRAKPGSGKFSNAPRKWAIGFFYTKTMDFSSQVLTSLYIYENNNTKDYCHPCSEEWTINGHKDRTSVSDRSESNSTQIVHHEIASFTSSYFSYFRYVMWFAAAALRFITTMTPQEKKIRASSTFIKQALKSFRWILKWIFFS